MKGNFIFFILLCAPEGAKCGRVNLIVVSTIWLKNGFSWMIVHEKWAFQVALYSIFGENTHVFQTFSG